MSAESERELMMSENDGFLEDDEDLGELELPEVLVEIEPDYERFEALGLSVEEFAKALPDALDRYHEVIDQLPEDAEIPDLEDAEVILEGQTHRLGDLAEVMVRGATEDDEDEDEDYGDDEDDDE